MPADLGGRERVLLEALADAGITTREDADRVLSTPELRRRLTRWNPLTFAALYLWKHLSSEATGGTVSFSGVHLDWCAMATRWYQEDDGPHDIGDRDAIIAPREMGKSTWWFLLLPMWAAAHGHKRFVAAFADSATQAETHLASFKHELETNTMLREDYPDLVAPLTRNRGVVAADRVSMYHASSGFVFAARGIDSSTLGLKVGELRPDLLILDDIEPDEARYSQESMRKRLSTLTDAILPLSTVADVVIVGTVTMAGSIVHQLAQWAAGRLTIDQETEWVQREQFTGHHYRPILKDPITGEERSLWPERWSIGWLQSMRGTRTFAKNYENDPKGANGDYWTLGMFTPGKLAGVTHVLLSVDPAVTSKKSSDQTGLAVLGYSPSERKVELRRARGVRVTPDDLRKTILAELERDEMIGLVLVETNQGGDVWRSILHDLPVPIATRHQTEPKEVRAARVANDYTRGRVVHWPGNEEAEGQMVAFPRAPHDDVVDAVGTGVSYFLHPAKKRKAAGGRVEQY